MLRDEQELTDDLKKAIFLRYREFIERSGKSDTWAAKSMDISAAVLSGVLNDNYAANPEPIIRKIDKWLEQQILREQAPKPGGFVKTRVAEMIYGVTRWIQKINAIGLVVGPAGCGKTISAQAVRAETPGSLFCSITTAGHSKISVLAMLVRAMRINGISLTSDGYFNLLVDRLNGTNRLIIIDECHKLVGRRRDESLHALRDLHELTQCPMLLIGMPNLATYIEQGKTTYEPLEQLDSRIKFRLNLSAIANREDGGPGLYTIDDIRKWLAAQNVRITSDAQRYLQMIANEPQMGGLRTCDGLLRVARVLAGDKQISAEMLREIFTEQRGTRFVDAFEQQVEIRRAAVG